MIEIIEFIEFGDFNSKDYNLFLEDRDAPTPEEKEIIETLPFMQGELDFSYMFNERYFKNREITYEFKVLNTPYQTRKEVENQLKRLLMPYFETPLYETFQNRHHWVGKCKSVKVKHDAKKRNFVVSIVFDVYPFAIANTGGFDDVWDTFDFDGGIASWTKYDIKGTQIIYLFNAGDRPVVPEVEASANFTIVTDTGDKYSIAKGKNEFLNMPLEQGLNTLVVNGTGTIRFGVFEEVMA